MSRGLTALDKCRKEVRSKVLYARVRPSRLAWVHNQMKATGHKSKSEFVDQLVSLLMDLYGSKKAKSDSHTKKLSKRNKKAKKARSVRARH